MKRILVDCTALQGRSWDRGIGKYVESLLLNLPDSEAVQFEVLVSTFDGFRELHQLKDFLNAVKSIKAVHIWKHDSELPVKTNQLVREIFIKSLEVDAVLITDLFESRHHVPISVKKYFDIPTTVILYDLIPYEDPDTFLPTQNSFEIYQTAISDLKKADHIFCISQYTRDSLVKNFIDLDDRATFVGGAANSNFRKNSHGEKKQIIAILGDDPRKNVSNLTRAWASLPEVILDCFSLKIIGKFSKERIEYFVNYSGLNEKYLKTLQFTGEISDLSLEEELNNSLALIHPAISEGLGLPILEAITLGIPAICSNNTSMSEIGRLGAVINPVSIDGIQESILRVIQDENYRLEILKSQASVLQIFNWSSTCARFVKVFHENRILNLDEGLKTLDSSIRPNIRVAVIAPSASQKTGIGRFANFLFPFLQHKASADFLATESLHDLENSLKILSTYDRVVIHLGNSPHHKNAFVIAANFPAVLICHDIKMGSTLRDLYRNDRNWMEELVELSGFEGDPLHLNALVRILNLSLGVVVHSKTAKDYLLSLGYAETKILLLEHPMLSRELVKRQNVCAEADLNQIDSFGFITPNKSPELLIKGIAILNERENRDIHLKLQGEVDPVYRIQLEGLATQLEVKLHITEYLNDDDYFSSLRRSNLAIQLRATDSGESSGVLSDLFRLGIPTIVNDIGSFKLLPNDVVIKIPVSPTALDVSNAISSLINQDFRAQLSDKALDFCKQYLGPEIWSSKVMSFMEERYELDLVHNGRKYSNDIRESDFLKFANACMTIEKMNERFGSRILLASDVSNFKSTSFISGIQRATLEIHSSLIYSLPSNAFLLGGIDLGASNANASIPHQQISNDLIVSGTTFLNSKIDALLLIDLNFDFFKSIDFSRIVERKIPIIANVYDVLPISNPEWFPPGATEKYFLPWLKSVFLYSSDVIVNSEATLNELQKLDFFKTYQGNITVAPLGIPGGRFTTESERVLGQTLIVGTIEPRKGHEDVLDAFDELENSNVPVTLHIVGRQGWMVEQLINRIKNHKSLNHTLFWHPECSDLDLQRLYAQSQLTLVASKGEGFGLPILEALSFGSHVIARNIPVFREVGGDQIQYFETDGSNLRQVWLTGLKEKAITKTVTNQKIYGYQEYSYKIATILKKHLRMS